MKAAHLLTKSGMANAGIIVQAARETGVELAIAAAFARQESSGHHIYGHDSGGMYSTSAAACVVNGATYPKGSNVPVGAKDFAAFLDAVVGQGKQSNGVGLFQITYAGSKLASSGGRSGGYFAQASTEGFDLADPLDNARFALGRIIGPALKGATSDAAILEAATRYNSGSWSGTPTAYGRAVLTRVLAYRTLLAAADGQTGEALTMAGALTRTLQEP